jgi:hypothetical protein
VKLRALSERVSRNVPHRRDPERFHIEKSCICQHLEHLASMIEERAEPLPHHQPHTQSCRCAAAHLSVGVLIVELIDTERSHTEKSCICQDLNHLASMVEEQQQRSLTNQPHTPVGAAHRHRV